LKRHCVANLRNAPSVSPFAKLRAIHLPRFAGKELKQIIQFLSSFPVHGEGGMARSDMTEGGYVAAIATLLPLEIISIYRQPLSRAAFSAAASKASPAMRFCAASMINGEAA